ncbi:MAG: GDP-mannose 4,6-dehydratase [Candidatus Hodarchaeota archaeon]
MAILVTGGAGFIGSHLVERLLEQEKEVIAIDNFDPFYSSKIKEKNIESAQKNNNFHLYKEDILNSSAIEKIFKNNNIDIVVHLAAKAGVRPSIKDPIGYYKVNVEGTINLLEACKNFGVRKFIFASSSSVYGNNQKVPFVEDDNVDFPISPYAASKKAAELICHNYYHLYGIKIFLLRFFTVYGPRQRPDLAIHKFFKLVEKEKEIPVFGKGDTSRDYTYIDDILEGIIMSIERVNGYEIINLGESKTIKLLNLIGLIETITGKSAKKNYLNMQPGDVLITYADISKAMRILDYHPKTDIKQGLIKFYEWFKLSKSI